MSGSEGRAPEIRARRLAPEGTLAGDFVRGRGDAPGLLLSRGSGPAVESARVGRDAFRVTGEEAGRRLEAALEGRGRLISTGQQPVIFGGPLYVLYKALSAIAVAERVEAESGEPALGLFWVGSDDHDWDEAGAVELLDLDNELREVRLEPPGGWDARSTGAAPLPETIEDRIDEIAQLLPRSEFVGSYLELLRGEHRSGRSLGEAFARTLTRLLAPRPLAVLDAARPELKESAAPFLLRSLERAPEEAEAVRRSSDAVRAGGYELQMPLLEDASHVFLDTGERRERLYRNGGTFRVGRGGREIPLSRLRQVARDEPARLSPNVALRPVLEAWLLPVSRSVLGPGELAYWAQLPELFALHEVPMPRVEGRCSWTVVEDKVAKVLRSLGAEPPEFRDGGASLVEEVVARSRPTGVNQALEELRASIGQGLQSVESAVGDELPGIRASVGKARSRLFEAVGELESAVDDRVEERQERQISGIRKAAAHLYPRGSPQERVLSPLYYLARYDDAFLEAVDRATRRRVLEDGGREGRER